MTDSASNFRPGLYRHYKGGLYTALALVIHHEHKRPMVLYVSHAYGAHRVRPLRGWDGDPDGWLDEATVDGQRVPRFAFVSEVPTVEPIA